MSTMAAVCSAPLVAAVDIGGTKTSAALVDADNRIVARAVGSTPATAGPDATLGAAAGWSAA